MIQVLAFFEKRKNYEQYREFVKETILTKETELILKDVGRYYSDVVSDDQIDWEEFETWFFAVAHSTMKKDRVEIFQKIFERLQTEQFSETLASNLLESFVQRDFATRIYKVAQDVAEGDKGDIEDVELLMEDYYDTIDKTKDIAKHEQDWDINSIVSSTIGSGGLSWRLPPLQEALGSIRDGDFILIGSRPDTGKTTMLASEATYMAQQLPEDEHVLWFNNEEAGRKVQLRLLQAALGATSEDIESDMNSAMDEYTRIMGKPDKIKLFDKATLSVKDVNEALKKYKPGLIIFDQLWKLHGVPEATNDVHKMTVLYNYGREWAKQHAPVITVHQADGSAGGQKYLTMEQLYMSKTGIQGELDAIVMLGRTYEPGFDSSRFISIPKNKLTGGTPAKRNLQCEVVIKPEIARFEEGEEL